MNISKKGLFFRELLQNWKELTLLLIDKKFWLITLKATIEAYKLLFRKFWWLIVLFIISSVLVRNSTLFIYYVITPPLSEAFRNQILGVIGIFYFILWSLLTFVTFLIIRPSLFKKEGPYFLQYSPYYIWFIIVTIFILIVENVSFVHRSWSTSWSISNYFVKYVLFLQNYSMSLLYLSPLLCIYTFFYLDTKWNIISFVKRIWAAFLLFVYTCPFCIIAWVGIVLLVVYTQIVMRGFMSMSLEPLSVYIPTSGFSEVLADDISKLFLPFFFCLINNLYTKHVHDHYDLYT
jgi:hypothetical protein